MKIKFRFFSLLLCFFMLAGNMVNVHAATNKNRHLPSTNIEKVAKSLEKYVKRQKNGTFALNAPKSALVKFDTESVNNLIDSMNSINTLILQGNLISKDDLSVINPHDKTFTIQDSGVNQVQYFWWGEKLWLSHNTTQNFVNMMNLGSSTNAMGAYLFSVVPGGQGIAFFEACVGGILSLGANVINVNDAGRGVVINMGAGFVPMWIGGQ